MKEEEREAEKARHEAAKARREAEEARLRAKAEAEGKRFVRAHRRDHPARPGEKEIRVPAHEKE